MSHYKSLIGNKYGMLTVIDRLPNYVSPKGSISSRYLCKCECGNTIAAVRSSLVYGGTVSCGCYRKNKMLKKNEYTIDGETIKVSTPRGAVLMDIQDLDIVENNKIYVNANGYPAIHKGDLLHRVIIGKEQKGIVDHINHNKLDNRRENLRVCDYSINGVNKKCMSNTGYIGISYTKKGHYVVSVDSKYCGIAHSLDDAIKLREDHLEGSRLITYNTYVQEQRV